ncbi:E3 UFM1-protein ligase 1 homolog [Magnolia sinica]|uniref:E3 UFM1-protein ligase 1 homolog n=1 Tax=Magnolia sinica TaxID=86752 RepID=UPI00265895C2|nr:E3 UFM1-protein ligase 1 homolog [Magnolia sinica]
MDAELLELQRQFESAQQAKSSIRLSERNVVELVNKLQELQIIDFELLHTVSGKEYITPDQLRLEIEAEITKSGRVSLIDLADIIGVDLYHVEKQAKHIVADNVGLMLIQGEIISQSYWDTIAEEINERLQECSQIALAELAAQLHVSSELISAVLEPRLGTLVKGRMEGGQLYTPAYVERITAMVRGAARGITVPTNLLTVWSSLQQLLLEMDGANGVSVEGSFFQSLFNGLVKEGEILGSVRAGVHWTPTVFAYAQKESVDSFFSQNSFISYDVLHKLAISQPKQYLQSRYPEGIPLDSVFVHPSMIEMLDSAVEDAIEQGSWIDCLSVLPAVYGGQDASKLLSLCPSVQRAMKSMKATILGESCILSNTFIKNVFDQIDKETETFNQARPSAHGLSDSSHSVNEHKGGQDTSHLPERNETIDDDSGSKHVIEKGQKKKRGKATGSSKAGAVENTSDILEYLPTKSKKNQRKNKDASSLQVADAKSSAKKDSDKMKEEKLNIISEEWIMQKISQLFPDFEGLGGQDDPDTFRRALAAHLRPMLLTSWKERRNALFMENSERRRHLLDNLQKKLDESFLDLQLYEKALDLFEDDPSTSVNLQKHLLRTTATSIMDMLLLNLDMDNKMKNGIEVEESQNLEPASLSAGDRTSIAKSLPGSLSAKAVAAVEALEGKRLDTFLNALRAVAEESGLLLKKLDKKLERTLLHSYRKDLTTQVSSETDPVALLPKVVSLLYLQVYNKALQAPGRAISVAISRLKNKMEDSAHKVLLDYHTATVTLLALLSAATEDEEDCTSDRALSKREFLESQMPELKAVVLNNNQT